MMMADSSVFGPVAKHLWQSSVCVIFAWSLTILLRNNGAAVRHWVWFFASLKFLVPLSLLVGIGHSLQPVVPAAVSPAPITAFVRVGSTIAFPRDLERLPAPTTPGKIPNIAALVWFLGAIVVARSWLRSWKRAATMVRTATPLQLRLPIEVRISQAHLAPGLVGIVRPVLVLPTGIQEKLSTNQFRAVLIHELAHLRRRDNLRTALHMIVEILFWFHPFVWWIGRRLTEERERACDEAVLRKLGKPRVYAEGILAVCRLYKEEPMAHVSGITHSNLQKRIAEIISHQRVVRMGFAKRGLLAAAAISVIGLPVLFGLVRIQPALAQTTEPLEIAQVTTRPSRAVVVAEASLQIVPQPSARPGEVVQAEPVPTGTPQAGPIIRNKAFFESLFFEGAARQTPQDVSKPPQSDYVLGVADELEISVWREPELSRRVVIRPDGKISLPLVNDIQAAGLTPMQLSRAIVPVLALRITDPLVTVMVVAVQSVHASITGNVQRPGEYPMPVPITLVELIARAGGFREFAKVTEIQVMRQQNGGTTRFIFNYDSYLNGANPVSNITLRPGDIVIVP